MGRRNADVIKKPKDAIHDEAFLRKHFKHHDKNGDGRLSKTEIKEAFKSLGALIPFYRANCGLNIADANGDGYISETELDVLVKYAYDLRYKIKY